MSKIRIAGAIASKTGITLYLEDGKEMNLPKDSHRTNEIMQKVAKPLAKRKIVELDLSEYSAHGMIEQKTGGRIRFLVKKAAEFLGFKGETGGVVGMIPVKGDETIVAVVDGKEIPGMAALERQIEHAAFRKNCKGFELFMQRLAAVVDQRGHSVQELLNFMKSADLPIADDGTIVAYKTLNYLSKRDGVFVDKHSKKVRQKLGSRVSMPMDKVDDSRRTQCSTGLHIARRQYLSNYYGDLLTLVKVAPEDVIAVPHGDPDKMRAMAYHIVYVLPDRISGIIRSNQSMTSDEEAAKILANIIAGDHVGVLEEVRISNEKAKFKSGKSSSHEPAKVTTKKKNAPEFKGPGDNGTAKTLDQEEEEPGEVDIRALNKKVDEAIAERDAAVAALKAKEKPKAKPKKKAAKKKPKAKPEPKVVDLPKKKEAAAPTAKPLTTAQQKREDAYQAVSKGMSQREAAKQFKVCPKSLRKMIKERAAKAAE